MCFHCLKELKPIYKLQPCASACLLIGPIHSPAQGRRPLTRRSARILYRNAKHCARRLQPSILDSRSTTRYCDMMPCSTTTLTCVFALLPCLGPPPYLRLRQNTVREQSMTKLSELRRQSNNDDITNAQETRRSYSFHYLIRD
jgi:hypothetical protein